MEYIKTDSDYALELLTKQLKNVFLSGPPGCGKTWLTNKYIEYWQSKFMNIAVTASTGIAAKLLGGTTVHSWSGIGIINEEDTFEVILKRVKDKRKKVLEWKKTDILVIDEISLIDMKTFDILNYIGRTIRNCDKPFGGIKLLIVGDFYQLPPVVGDYCFKYKEWESTFDTGIVLNQIHRSDDNNLNKILSRIRKGKELTEKMSKILEKRISDEEYYPLLVPLRSMARKINHDKLLFNTNKEHVYKATYYYDNEKTYMKEVIDRTSPLEEILILKVGCPVINLINDHTKRLMNGMVGEVVSFSHDGPMVKFGKRTIQIKQHMWEKKIEGKKVMMEQYPLLLAYSITIHRSQGQTLSQASMILDHNVWEKGQGYVALSRLQSLDGLYLLKYSPDIFKVDKNVKKYYKKWK